ncbi:uncharacterized protein il11b [Danio rerio]|uniref:Uncharacterized protein il11b n=1 Tax=Danio rerio TaxID=7955 RepID=A0A8M9PSA0_DANRE|nr:TPA: interleukin-11b [Danio rerio]
MKLSPDSTFPLIILMACVELFDFIRARPANLPQGKKHLSTLYQDMRMLLKLTSQQMNANELTDFEHSLSSLPSLNYSVKDLHSLEVSSTLAQLYSGLKSFKFHLDWVQRNSDELGNDYSKTKKIVHLIQAIIQKVLQELGQTAPEIVHPTLPPLETFWQLYQTNAEIHKKLLIFCDYYTRALGSLKRKHPDTPS